MDKDVAPPVAMVQLLAGFQISQALYVIAKLGIADLLTDRPQGVDELAAATGSDAPSLRRLLRTACALGLFETRADDTLAVTPLGRTLASDDPGSMRDLAVMWMETHYAAFGSLLHTVRTGEPAATRYYGRPFFDWLAGDPEQVARFSGAMANLTAGIKLAALDAVELSGHTIVDVGGADGRVLGYLLQREPERRGIVLDLPQVVPAVGKVAAEMGVSDRLEAVGGDFFADVPVADTYLLSMVLHDWADDQAKQILTNVRRAGGLDGQLRIVDFVVPPGDEPHMSKMIDLTMLGMLTGRERTEDEWSDLLDRSGFRVDRFVPTAGPLSIIEASPR